MNFYDDQKRLYVFGGLCLLILIAVGVFLWRQQVQQTNSTPQGRVALILKDGVDTSHSLFPPDQNQSILNDINTRKQKFLSGSDASAENLEDLARRVRDLRDDNKALALFAVVDSMNPPDLFYKIDEGNIYIDDQNWDAARQVFEPMRVTLPVSETYIGLAEAYQHISGTPSYVIDQIYQEGLQRDRDQFEVVEAYVKWLESVGREKDTLQYYIIMNQERPQDLLQKRIQELKAKYPQ